MEYVIRPAMIDDYDRVVGVFAEVEELHRAALPNIMRRADGPALDHAFYATVLADESATWLVAERAGEIVGSVHVAIAHSPERPFLVPRRYAHVHTLAVLVACQGSGVGRALMEQAERWAAERGVTEVELNVWEFNQGAIAFYERLGYTTERRTMRRVIDNANS